MDDFGSNLSEKIAKPKRKRLFGSSGDTDQGIVDAIFDAPAVISAGVDSVGRLAGGMASKIGIGGEKGESESADAGAGIIDGIGKAASAVGDLTGQAISMSVDGVGHIASNAGSLASSAGELLAGAGSAAGEILSAVAEVAGPVAEAAGDAAGEILGSLGDITS